ncbi:hypothetical protein TNCV_1011091 [Trichonephila clavipes]|uniref:Paired domain-containing protein n=1 Tax=Trichonephila clavipes TaxID=2585209 RepID=A0A8X6VX94_TRICX|nr:hypothetical protein TNCV_1011091 [Trichonephila clavipes]
MSSRHHIDDLMRGRIIGKIEEGGKITDVAREFDIAHSVVSRLWKSFKTTGMCSRWHGEVVLEVRRLQKTDISSYQQKGTAAPQLSRQVAGRNYPPTNKNTLIRALTEEWDKLPQQLLDNVVQSMLPGAANRSQCSPYPASNQRAIALALSQAKKLKTFHPEKNHSHASRIFIARPIAVMPLSRMENTTFAMPSIIDSRYGIEDCLQSRRPKLNAYSTPMTKANAY